MDGDIQSLENWEGDERDFEKGLIIRERDVQKQMEGSKIREARYNVRYKDWCEGLNRPRICKEMRRDWTKGRG